MKRKTDLTHELVLILRAAGFTLAQIGDAHGISRERVRQIEKNIRLNSTLRIEQRATAYKRLDAIDARQRYRDGVRIAFIARKASVTFPMAKQYLAAEVRNRDILKAELRSNAQSTSG